MKLFEVFKSNGVKILHWRTGEDFFVDGMSRQFQNIKLDTKKLVHILGEPLKYLDVSDVNYEWQIEIDYQDPSQHDMTDKHDYDTVTFYIYTTKYGPDYSLPPLEDQEYWNVSARNNIYEKAIIADFIEGLKKGTIKPL